MQDLRITTIQSSLVWESPTINRRNFESLIRAHNLETDLILLPEMFTTGFSMNPKPLAESMTGASISWMKKISQEKKCAIAGSLIIKEDEKYFNRFVLFHPNKELPETYDKRHLFSMAGENEHYSPGSKKLYFDLKGWKIMPLICYDLRFPVWSRNTADYDVLIYVANWPSIRRDAWNTLLKARSIENQAFCIGLNRIGVDGKGLQYAGDSSVYTADGIRTFHSEFNTDISTHILTKTALEKVRKKLPFLQDRD